MKKIIYIVLVTVIFSLTVKAEQQYKKFANGLFVFPAQGLTINVEIAKNKKQRANGLMFREKLATNKGMLFVFEKEAIQRLWMKNTLIPLDIIFISADANIVSIIKNIQPCRKNPCAIYNSKEKAKYMLEVNAGFVAEKGIGIAEKVRISPF